MEKNYFVLTTDLSSYLSCPGRVQRRAALGLRRYVKTDQPPRPERRVVSRNNRRRTSNREIKTRGRRRRRHLRRPRPENAKKIRSPPRLQSPERCPGRRRYRPQRRRRRRRRSVEHPLRRRHRRRQPSRAKDVNRNFRNLFPTIP